MKKFSVILLAIILAFNLTTVFVFASETKNDFTVELLSPHGIKDYPGREETVKVKITNNSSKDINEVLAYITMADIKKNMTVNLEDYSADKPFYIKSIKAGEAQMVDLPIRFVYTSTYYLYVTVVTKENNMITSSNAIPIEIIGNTKINKPLTMSVAVAEPLLLLGIVGVIYGIRKRKYKVK
ncbi:hypothetical protein [Clostridium grantii]|uniref:CARDB domain-containing protein n=1 Tax=Clostridium grantii DSM 8605 TaxID=1121316 RepID=A0A1M5WYF6_9CLOT|nr:hypothetical protein [Clostridium grantii]SHH92214.1 hypothetical protein SAMN02745207_03193 [Clostridium grantii DSM 8605]